MPDAALNNLEINPGDRDFEAFDAFIRTSAGYLDVDIPAGFVAGYPILQDGSTAGRYSC